MSKSKTSTKSGSTHVGWSYYERNIGLLRKYIKKRFNRRFEILQEIINHQFQITMIMVRHLTLKQWARLRFKPNELLPHVLLTQPVITNSCLLLLKNGYFGSTRPILRQNFELQLIAKYADYDSTLIEKWLNKKEGRDKLNEINLTRDIFIKLESKHDIAELKKMWATLCDLTHGTQYAQQKPPSYTSDEAGIAEFESDIANVHQTLDLIFMILCMNMHLINLLHRKTRGFYFGYKHDPFGDEGKIIFLKGKIKQFIHEYYTENKKEKIDSRKIIGSVIRQFSTKWC